MLLVVLLGCRVLPAAQKACMRICTSGHLEALGHGLAMSVMSTDLQNVVWTFFSLSILVSMLHMGCMAMAVTICGPAIRVELRLAGMQMGCGCALSR